MFRELEIEWGGESKRLKPTMDLLRYLEQRDLGPHYIANLIAQRKAAPATMASFVSAVLQYAGIKASADDVYLDAHQQDGGFQKLTAQVMIFATAMLPDTAPKVDAPAKKPRTASKPVR